MGEDSEENEAISSMTELKLAGLTLWIPSVEKVFSVQVIKARCPLDIEILQYEGLTQKQ